MSKKHVGGTLDSWLEDEGLRRDAEAVATKRVVALALEKLMRKQALTKQELACRMGTSRAALDRLLEDARRVQEEVTEQLRRLWRPRTRVSDKSYSGPERRQWPRVRQRGGD